MSAEGGAGPRGLRVRGLDKRFRAPRSLREALTPGRAARWRTALRGVDLDVGPGEAVALLGPNGAGKTTLLDVVADLVEPDAGEVWVDGWARSRSARAVRARVGYVLAEERSFVLRLSVRDNLRFFARLDAIPAIDGRIEALADRVGLGSLLDARFGDLSSGQKQRVGIVRGLLPDPPVVLFDEATRALDPGWSRRLRRWIREELVERDRRAVLFATHRLEEARALGDRAVLLVEGRVIADGPWAEVAPEAERAFADRGSEATW